MNNYVTDQVSDHQTLYGPNNRIISTHADFNRPKNDKASHNTRVLFTLRAHTGVITMHRIVMSTAFCGLLLEGIVAWLLTVALAGAEVHFAIAAEI